MGLTMRRRPNVHVVAFLPRYRQGQLTAPEILRVRRHLQACLACREEVALSSAASRRAGEEMAALVAPSMGLLDEIWSKIDAPVTTPRNDSTWPVAQLFAGLCALLGMQARLLPKGLWAASAMAVAFATAVGLAWRGGTFPPFMLGLIIAPVAAAGASFLHGPEHDPGLEVALATRTPPQVVMACRFLIALGYNCVAALASSGVLALSRGGNLPTLVASWLGPTVFVTGLSVLVSVRHGSTPAFTVVALLWCGRILSFIVEPAEGLGGRLVGALDAVWQTTPLVLAAATVLCAAALLSVPRDVHVA